MKTVNFYVVKNRLYYHWYRLWAILRIARKMGTFGKWLVSEREKQGMRRTDLALLSKVSRYVIDAIEVGDIFFLVRNDVLPDGYRLIMCNLADALGHKRFDVALRSGCITKNIKTDYEQYYLFAEAMSIDEKTDYRYCLFTEAVSVSEKPDYR